MEDHQVTGSELAAWEWVLEWVLELVLEWVLEWVSVWVVVLEVELEVAWAQGCRNLNCSGTPSPHHFRKWGHYPLLGIAHMMMHHPICSNNTDWQPQRWPNQQSKTCAS